VELDRERILELVQILKNSGAAELAVTEGETRIRLVRGVAAPAPVVVDAPLAAETEPGAAELAPAAPAEIPAAVDEDVVVVRSRVVGLFYRGKQAGGEPLVEAGQEVREGQLLGIIEVLRKPTEVTSPVAGVLEEVVAEEAHGVQYGDPLFTIRPEV
jgi:acetyl-CoA carboxylase biotin carboxyl carrier protein